MKTDLHFQPTLSKLQNFQQTSIQLFFVFSENASKQYCIDITFSQDVPHSQKTFKYIKTDTYIFYGPYTRAY